MYGNKLKEIRKAINCTQEQFAKELSIPLRTYTSYEREENNPPYSMLVLLFEKYSINLNWFLADNGAMRNVANNTLELNKIDLNRDFKDFGDRLCNLIKTSKLDSAYFAMLMDISDSRLTDLCIGIKPPKTEEIKALCENFKVTADWLLFGRD